MEIQINLFVICVKCGNYLTEQTSTQVTPDGVTEMRIFPCEVCEERRKEDNG